MTDDKCNVCYEHLFGGVNDYLSFCHIVNIHNTNTHMPHGFKPETHRVANEGLPQDGVTCRQHKHMKSFQSIVYHYSHAFTRGITIAMHSLAVASRPRPSETQPKCLTSYTVRSVGESVSSQN